MIMKVFISPAQQDDALARKIADALLLDLIHFSNG